MFLALIGGHVNGVFRGWIFALFAVVIVADVLLGQRDRIFMTFAKLYCVGLFAGYVWTVSVARKMDVAGPWAWAIVVGAWTLCVLAFHGWALVARRRMLLPR